mgnify:CR=1 FL=1
MLAGFTQSVQEGPGAGIADNSSSWFAYTMIGVLLFGGLASLTGLYLADENCDNAGLLNVAVSIELLGVIALQTATIVNMTGVIANRVAQPESGFWSWAPPSPSSWYSLGFSLWMWFRLIDLLLAIRSLTKNKP